MYLPFFDIISSFGYSTLLQLYTTSRIGCHMQMRHRQTILFMVVCGGIGVSGIDGGISGGVA